MTSSLRDVTIKVGRSVYHVRTSLDDESLLRVTTLMAEFTGELEHTLDQEKI
ncbi:MAG: hypothetical protein GX635_13805, partial [Synergistaceae bacterium]|nr:hypothetical protein [Synergistaceae bacterium]